MVCWQMIYKYTWLFPSFPQKKSIDPSISHDDRESANYGLDGILEQVLNLNASLLDLRFVFPMGHRWNWRITRPGKHTKNYGKSPFFMGKSTISMAIFNSYVKLSEGTGYKWGWWFQLLSQFLFKANGSDLEWWFTKIFGVESNNWNP